MDFVFYGQEGSIFATQEKGRQSRLSQEEARGEHSKDKAGEEGVLPVVLHESEVED